VDKGLAEQWQDLLHYIKVARADLAQTYAKAILDSGKPREVYVLSVETSASQAILARGAALAGMKELVERLDKMIEQGFQEMRMDPAEIGRSIEKLTESVRAYEIHAKRLELSGEYAMPQLIQKLMDDRTSELLRERIIQVLPRLGKEAVRPLSVALQTQDAQLREIFANTLGQIEYPHAAARLRELYEVKDLLPRTKAVVESALITCGGKGAAEKSVAQTFYDLALKYYYQADSVRPDERFDTANVWYWKTGEGLSFVPVPREVFCDIYAMRMARMALAYDEDFYPAVSLWLAANLKREADLPSGATDPTMEAGSPTARYYIRASGARYAQEVLARALNDYNSTVALGAIEALSVTAGAKSLVEPIEGGAQPLVQAMTYPDRRVRFQAALTLAGALPDKRFTGYDLVLLSLNEALRQTGKKAALVIAADPKENNVLKDAVRAGGYTVLAHPAVDKAMDAARAIGGVDLVVIGVSPPAVQVIAQLRQESTFAAAPIVVIASETPSLRGLADQDKRVVLAGGDGDPARLTQAIGQAPSLAAGKPLADEEVTQWAVRSAEAIRLLGLTKNPVLDVRGSRGLLIEALAAAQEPVKIAAAGALAVMAEAEAQQAIAGLAASAEASETVRVAAMGALAESVRKFGNQLTEAQAQAILDIVIGEKTDNIRNAAAQDLGALNLPSQQIRSLITETKN